MLAVTAARTRIVSRPSRKTSRPLSTTTAPWLRWELAVGSGVPPEALSALQASRTAPPPARYQGQRRAIDLFSVLNTAVRVP